MLKEKIISQRKIGDLSSIQRPHLLNLSDDEIVKVYNFEVRGICNYYCLAANYSKLSYFRYFCEYSCLKTLAGKHKSSIRKIIGMYRNGKRVVSAISNVKW